MKRIDKKTAARLEELGTEICDLVLQLNTKIDDWNGNLEAVEADAQSHFDERSLRWQEESDAGANYTQWIVDLEDKRIEEVNEPDTDLESVQRPEVA